MSSAVALHILRVRKDGYSGRRLVIFGKIMAVVC